MPKKQLAAVEPETPKAPPEKREKGSSSESPSKNSFYVPSRLPIPKYPNKQIFQIFRDKNIIPMETQA
jgi:hypothetical protein